MRAGFYLGALLALWASAVPAQEGAGATPTALVPGQTIAGELTPNDNQRHSGKFEDVYALSGRRGQRVDLRLTSDDFDPYLLVTGPGGFSVGNDDEVGGNSLNSRIVLAFPADGTYLVSATSFRPGATGHYRLVTSVPDTSVPLTVMDSADPIGLPADVTGTLTAADPRNGQSFIHRYRFTAHRGQRITAELTSDAFDTVLTLRHPDGTEDENDDAVFNGRPSLNSRIETVLPDDGNYVLGVTSFRAEATGKYQLILTPSAGSPRQVNVPGGPHVVALLVGISDYGGRTSNLANTDEDARQLYASLRSAGLLSPASILLTNAQATSKAVAAAFGRAAAQAGPNDLFLFFFSGHGDQIPAVSGSRELNGRTETIELYDTAMTNVALEALFNQVHSRIQMVALDSCYSGGFRNLINRPNSIGLFSSEADLTSLVADRFKAGGYLAYFLRTGLAGAADEDGDRIVTAGELSTYLRRRFRREGEIPATTRDGVSNYQNLVIERGGLAVDDVIVRLGGNSQSAAVASIHTPSQAQRVQPDRNVRRPLIDALVPAGTKQSGRIWGLRPGSN